MSNEALESMSFAFDVNGELINILDVEVNGLGCQCTCICCGGQLIAKKNGYKKAPHFCHSFNTNCNWSGETQIHAIAKNIIFKDSFFYSKFKTVTGYIDFKIDFIEISVEAVIGEYVSDLLGKTSDQRLFAIEICVTHKNSDAKDEFYKRENLNNIEITIPLSYFDGKAIITEELVRESLKNSETRINVLEPLSEFYQFYYSAHAESVQSLREEARITLEKNKQLKLEKSKLESHLKNLNELLRKKTSELNEIEKAIREQSQVPFFGTDFIASEIDKHTDHHRDDENYQNTLDEAKALYRALENRWIILNGLNKNETLSKPVKPDWLK